MMRGDLVTISVPGHLGKPRPALVIQANFFAAHPSVTVLPLSSTLVQAPLLRITVQASELSGLYKTSQVMVDKTSTVLRDKVGPVFGRLSDQELQEVDRCLALFLGIAR